MATLLNKEVFGSVADKKNDLLQQTEQIDREEEQGSLSNWQRAGRLSLKANLIEVTVKEYRILSQKSMIKEGDENTSFFTGGLQQKES